MLIANSEGLYARDEQARTRFSVSCVASGDTGLQTGFETAAQTLGFELFDEVSVEELAHLAANRAVSKLSARPAPSGELPVVLAGGSGGILFHEACGHGLEADHIVKDASVYTGMVGQQVASPLVTLVDDGTVGSEWGTFQVDDEGRPAQRNVLIDQGILTDYLWDYLRARKEGRVSSGNGRRQTYQHLPMVRMTNTFLLPGSEDADEIVAQTPKGVYVAKLGGGQVNTTTGDFVFGTTEAYLIEGGKITEPLARRQPHRQRPRDPQADRRRGHGFRHDAGYLRQGWPERPGGVRTGHHAPDRGDHRRDGRVSAVTDTATTPADGSGTDDLVAVAERVAGWARSGEELEVYVARGDETDIRAYGGEVESLTSATSAGIGIRVVVDHKLGFAWAGSLDHSVLEETLAEARDNATYATPDEHVQLAVPDGVAAVPVDLWDGGLVSVPTTEKVALALALEAQARAADPRIRQVDHADYGDAAVEVALVSTTGIRSSSRKTSGYISVGVIAGEGEASQTGSGFSVDRGFAGLDPDQATSDAVTRAVRMLGATKGPSGRSAVVFDRRAATTLLSVVSSALSGEAVAKGRSFFAGRIGEVVGDVGLTLVDDPTDPRAYAAAAYDAEGLACRRNVLIDQGVLRAFLYDTVSASRAGVASTGSAVRGGFAGTPGPGCRALTLAPGPEGYDEDGVLAAVGEGLFVQSMTGVHSGVNPISGDFSVGAEGLMIRDGRLAEPVREITVASTLQRILQSLLAVGGDVEWLPGIAAGQTLAVGDMQISGV